MKPLSVVGGAVVADNSIIVIIVVVVVVDVVVFVVVDDDDDVVVLVVVVNNCPSLFWEWMLTPGTKGNVDFLSNIFSVLAVNYFRHVACALII